MDREKEESKNIVWEMYFLGASAPTDSCTMKMIPSGSFDSLPGSNLSPSLCYLFNMKLRTATVWQDGLLFLKC